MKYLIAKDQRKYELILNAGEAADSILAATQVDILEPEKYAAEIQQMISHPRTLRKALWALLSDQAGDQTESEFFANFEDWSEVREAFESELVDFIQTLSRAQAERMRQMKLAAEQATEEVISYLTSKEVKQTVSATLKDQLEKDLSTLQGRITKALGSLKPEDSEDE